MNGDFWHTHKDQAEGKKPKSFLGVYFPQCIVYGRFYKNAQGDAYTGSCPKCGRSFRVRVDAQGTEQRIFKANCRS